MGKSRGRTPDTLGRLFLDVTGELPDDASVLRMRRVSGALNLRDNDALWSVLVMLEYYGRLYEVMPERIRQAGAGSLDAVRTEAHAATDALMTQHRDALARCKATIELAERMTGEHEARYRAALAELDRQALTVLVERASGRLGRMVGNRLVGVTAMAARDQRQRLDAAVASLERGVMRRVVRACYGLMVYALVVLLLSAGAGWWAGSHLMRVGGVTSTRANHSSSVSPAMNAAASRSMREGAPCWSTATIGTL
jgi:hypothetical protein